MKLQELLEIKDIGNIKAKTIFYIVVFLYILSIAYYMQQYMFETTIGGYMYEHSMSMIFAPIYEEVLFRGIILIGLLKIFSSKKEVIFWSGILFAIWHLKNFPFQSAGETIHQVIYTMFLGFLFTWLALKYKTIWLGVLLHFVNNIFLSPLSFFLLYFFFKK